MRRWLAVILLGISSQLTWSQGAANDWIDYSADRRYLKIRIHDEGLYRISYSALNTALAGIGVDINDVDPRAVQLFSRGEEQYIHVEGASDGAFDSGDFIEFFGEGNDGWLDASMYPSVNQHTNPHYSLYNDTAVYFLTWDPSGTSSAYRFTTIGPETPSSLPLDYVWQEEVKVYASTYQKGKDLGQGVPSGNYVGGKGWMSTNFGYNGSNTSTLTPHSFDTPGLYNPGNAPDARLEVAVSGVNQGASGTVSHHVQVSVNGGAGYTVVDDLLYDSYDYGRYSIDVDPSLLGSTSTVRLLTSSAVSLITTTSDYNACAYIKLQYPRSLDLQGASSFRFKVPAQSAETYFSATNFTTSTTTHLYDLGQRKRYQVNHNTSNGTVQCNIDAGAERDCFLASVNAAASLSAGALIPVGGDGIFEDPAQWERDQAYLLITHASLQAQAQAYANHRENDYNVVLIDIEDLYDQFAYGIRKHPLSIRNFVDYTLTTWTTPPSFLFLVGKSIEERTARKSSTMQASNLVPAMGNPVSDILLTAGLNGEPSYVPAVPTGRLAARTDEEVLTYLSKMREFEDAQNELLNSYTLGNRKWQKHILHFAGGDNATENNRFQSYLKGYQSFAEDSLFAGKVFLFSKTSGNVIQQLNTDSVRLLIEQGPAIMTFFGHASGNSFDLSVDDPSLWNNRGKYPLVIANSCFSGNIHLPVDAIGSISEQYVFTPNEGSIAFMATPDLSFETNLNTYTRALYRHFSRDNYGATVGEQMQATCRDMPNDEHNTTIALEMTLHGDPALRLYSHDATELTINDPVEGAAIRFEPENITTDLDSFDALIRITNLGRSTNRSFTMTATRRLPDGSEVIKTKEINGINFTKEVRFRFAVDAENGVGTNQLQVQVDLPLNLVPEFEETSNNQILQSSFFVSSSDIFPVVPYQFAVVPDFDVTLKANTGFPLTPSRAYRLELDTTDRYNGLGLSTTITQSGAVIEWDPGLESYGFADSTVFFWRVTPSDDTTKWRQYSFQVIQGKEGWGQDHFYQYEDNELDLLELDRDARELAFEEASRDLFVQVVGNPPPSEYNDNFYSLDGQAAPLGEYGIASVQPGMAVVVIDSSELKPWGTYGVGSSGQMENADKRFGNNNDGPAHRTRVEYFFTFSVTSSTQMNSMINMIENEVEDGHYLLVYTQLRGLFDDSTYWSDEHLDFFEGLGADSIRHVGNLNPYIFLVKKGSPATAIQRIGTDDRSIIKLSTKLLSNFRIGSMDAPRIGPARSWTSMHFKPYSIDPSVGDSAQATFYGINQTDDESAQAVLTSSGTSDLTHIDSDSIPYGRLSFYTEDNTYLTPAQLGSWHVLYAPVPDAAVNPVKGITILDGAEVVSGLDVRFGVAFENISTQAFGPIKVHYWMLDKEGELVDETWLSYDSLAPGELVFDSVAFSTTGRAGRHLLYMEVNPMDEDWHYEQYAFNNRIFTSIDIIADDRKPVLDVTFDGVHILNGDIVSPQPQIIMELKDENPYLLMDDTSSFDVYLRQPNGTEARIPFIRNGEEIMLFEPASGTENKARITYQPKEAWADGSYRLQVMGKDASGNMSGDEAYEIEFEVINRSTVTQVVNYPNPFSTSTRFVFTLTGSHIPEVFTIQIMTVTGKVVREITRTELGDIRIGRNVSEYAWDGRDEFGDRLANGVYLYRVIMKINGEQIEHRATNADQYFTQDFGKMYLFR